MQILHGDAYAGSPERMIGGVSSRLSNRICWLRSWQQLMLRSKPRWPCSIAWSRQAKQWLSQKGNNIKVLPEQCNEDNLAKSDGQTLLSALTWCLMHLTAAASAFCDSAFENVNGSESISSMAGLLCYRNQSCTCLFTRSAVSCMLTRFTVNLGETESSQAQDMSLGKHLVCFIPIM